MSEDFFQFHSPEYFLLLLILLPLFIFDLKKLHLFKFGVSSADVFKKTKRSLKSIFEFIPPLMRFFALALLVVALARPQQGNRYTEVNSEGIDIVLALDTSGSMKALDLKLNGKDANRLQVVKSVVADFVDGRAYDRIGMVVFGTQAYTQCPLTLDYDILKGYMDLIHIGIAGEETAIGNAIATSVKRLKGSKAKSRIIILLTDGENTAGSVSPLKAAELAQKAGIKIYTIAVGSSGQAPFPVKSFFGTQKVMMNLSVDTKSLQEIAKLTGGQFYQARDTEALANIYKTIDQLEKTEVKVNEFAEYHEMFIDFLIPAIILLLLAWFLQKSIFLRIP